MMKGRQAYVQTQVTTLGQGEVLILLYDGAIKFLRLAKEKIFEQDYAEKGKYISKALDIVSELDMSVNDEIDAELAKNLHGLYELCSSNLLQANLRLDVKLIDSVIKMLGGLRSAFAEIVNTPEARAAAQSIADTLQTKTNSTQHPVSIPKNQQMTGIGRVAAQLAYGQQAPAMPKPVATTPLATPNVAPAMPKPVAATPLATPNTAPPMPKPVAATPLAGNTAPAMPKPVAATPLATPNTAPAMPKPVAATPLATPNTAPAMPKPVAPVPLTPSPVQAPVQTLPNTGQALPSSFAQRKMAATSLYGKIANS